MNIFFSVFTATYNRGYCLHRVYNSLLNQSFKSFEWVIVDDGSDDSTGELVNAWIKENKLVIKYKYQTNQGKPTAWNKGLEIASGQLFVNLDSDDSLLPEALKVFYDEWQLIGDKQSFYGVVGLTVNTKQEINGDKFPQDILDLNSIDLVHNYKINGDKSGALLTEVLCKFKFPKFKDEKFVPESLIWTRIAKEYKQRYINIPVKMCNSGRLDSFTINMGLVRFKNKLGYLTYYHELCNLSNIPLSRKFKYRVGYYAMKLHCYKILEASGYNLSVKSNLFITVPARICGFVLFILDTYRYSKKDNN